MIFIAFFNEACTKRAILLSINPNIRAQPPDKNLNADLLFCKNCIENITELDATIRVYTYVKNAMEKIEGQPVKLSFQSSLEHHAVFTDLAFCTQQDGKFMSLIEVKKNAIAPSLILPTPATAQILGEVHILLSTFPALKKLPFIFATSQNHGNLN